MTSGSTRELMALCAIAQHFGRPGTPTVIPTGLDRNLQRTPEGRVPAPRVDHRHGGAAPRARSHPPEMERRSSPCRHRLRDARRRARRTRSGHPQGPTGRARSGAAAVPRLPSQHPTEQQAGDPMMSFESAGISIAKSDTGHHGSTCCSKRWASRRRSSRRLLVSVGGLPPLPAGNDPVFGVRSMVVAPLARPGAGPGELVRHFGSEQGGSPVQYPRSRKLWTPTDGTSACRRAGTLGRAIGTIGDSRGPAKPNGDDAPRGHDGVHDRLR